MQLFPVTTLLVGIAAAVPPHVTALTVLARDRDVIIGKSCSTSLNKGNFAQFPITSQLDDYGSGTGSITIGNNAYAIHSDTNASGSISCSRLFGEAILPIECDAAIPATIQLIPVATEDISTCVTDAFFSAVLENEALQPALYPPTEGSSTDFNSTDFNSAELDTEFSKLQSNPDGSPTQSMQFIQLSENIFCGAASECSAGREDATSYTIGFSVAGALTRWASVGFAVEQSRSTGNTYSCTGQRNERVCIRYMMAYTIYNVFNSMRNRCRSISRGNRARITSPNANNKRGGYICGVGTAQCNYKNYRWWITNYQSGGP
ncbi:hypothetical protein J3F84DRAFT_396359 [Trichoderma pleuroticola]